MMIQMEKLVNHCDMELMKMAMLKHEESPSGSRYVHELRRLYRVQQQPMMSGLTEPAGCRPQRRRLPRRALDLHLPADEYIDATPPPAREDGLELTLAFGGGSSRRKRRDEGTPLASDDCSSRGSPTSSSTTDTSGPSHRRAVAFRLPEGAVVRQQQQQQTPWLVQCLGLRMA